MQIRRAAVALFVAGTLAACGSEPAAPTSLGLDRAKVAFDQVGIDQTREDVTALVGTATDLGARLLADDTRAGSSAVSPWSTLALLGMLRAGAEGRSAEQLDAVGLGSARNLPRAMAALTGQTEQWAKDPGTVTAGSPPAAPLFQSQVALLTAKAPAVKEDYLETLSEDYNTGVYPVDFSAGVNQPLGEWVAVNTGSTLTSAPLRTDADTRIAAAATAYLAAAWRFPFDASQTRTVAFTTADGSPMDVSAMHGTVPTRVASGDGFTALQIDYGTTIALQIVLPAPGAPLSDVTRADRLGAARVALAAAPLQAHAVSLPKWRTAKWSALVDPLRAAGVTDIFSGAGLAGIASGAPTVADARSATVFTVGEKGTASSTPETSGAASAPQLPSEATPFAVDRAFAYSVVDTATGLPLIMGTVNRPGE